MRKIKKIGFGRGQQYDPYLVISGQIEFRFLFGAHHILGSCNCQVSQLQATGHFQIQFFLFLFLFKINYKNDLKNKFSEPNLTSWIDFLILQKKKSKKNLQCSAIFR